MIRIRVGLTGRQVQTTGGRGRGGLHPGAVRRLRRGDGGGREWFRGAGTIQEGQHDQQDDGDGREDQRPPDRGAARGSLALGLARATRLVLALATLEVGAPSRGGGGRGRPLRGRPRPLLLRCHHAGGTKLAGTGFGTWLAEPNARTITCSSFKGICVGSPVHSLPLTYARRV